MADHLIALWESAQPNFSVSDKDKSIVDGEHILAVVEGPTFFPNTTSRNGVYYPLEAWQKAINDEEFQYRLKNNLVYGTIGHDIELTDNEIRQGLHSHIVTNVWLDNGVGYARYYVLGTAPGKVLNTLLRAKSKVSTSTKASGILDESTEKNEVVPESFKLERIDFVIDPGYLEATPQLVESLNKLKGLKMNEGSVKNLESQIRTLQESKQLDGAAIVTLSEAVSQAKVELAEAKASLNLYESLGTPVELHEKLNKLKVYESIGETPEEVKSTVEDAADLIDDLADQLDQVKDELKAAQEQLGESPESYKETLAKAEAGVEELKAFKEVAETPEAAKELVDNAQKAMDDLQKYAEMADAPEEIEELITTAQAAVEELDAYRELGSVEEIQELMDAAGDVVAQQEEAEVEKAAVELGVDKDVVESFIKRGIKLKEARKLIKAIREDADGEDPENETPDNAEEPKSVSEAINRLRNRKNGARKVDEAKGKEDLTVAKPAATTTLAESLITRLRSADASKRTNVRKTRKFN